MQINNKKMKTLLAGVGISSVMSLFLAFCLSLVKVPLTVILPTSAPIWVGIATMVFMVSN